MRASTVLAAASTLLLISIAKAQDSCVMVPTFPIGLGAGTVPKAPFTATVKLTFDQKLADGNAIHTELRYHIARDASGKTMNELPSGCFLDGDGQMRRIIRITVRFERTMEEWNISDDRMQKIATIVHFSDPVKPSEAELAAMRARASSHPPQTNQVQTEALGNREFYGIRANGIRRTVTIPAGQQGNALPLVTTTESWASPRYGPMMVIIDDPRRGRTTAEIEEFHQGDPDPSLFTPPRDYIVKEQPVSPPATIVSAPTTPQ
jgi:hypothetical protein